MYFSPSLPSNFSLVCLHLGGLAVPHQKTLRSLAIACDAAYPLGFLSLCLSWIKRLLTGGVCVNCSD